MKGIIYCNKLETGFEKLKKIIEKYDYIGIKCEQSKINTFQAFAVFTNGDYWLVVKANSNARGHACNIAYIDRMIPHDIVEQIIMPAIKAFPYQAYNYYN